jgi:hypothetical protein
MIAGWRRRAGQHPHIATHRRIRHTGLTADQPHRQPSAPCPLTETLSASVRVHSTMVLTPDERSSTKTAEFTPETKADLALSEYAERARR